MTGLNPLAAFTKTKSDHSDLLWAHVWSIPAFVLNLRFQDGKKIPKWDRRSRQAQFVGYLSENSLLVAKVRHLQKNHVSSQYHLIHNNNFETILMDSPLDHLLSDMTITELFDISC